MYKLGSGVPKAHLSFATLCEEMERGQWCRGMYMWCCWKTRQQELQQLAQAAVHAGMGADSVDDMALHG